METNDLIPLLVRDLKVRWSLQQAFMVATILGVLLAAVLFSLGLGLRPDIAQAMHTIRFPLKFVITLTLAIPAGGLALRMACPGASVRGWAWALAAAPIVLGFAVLAELFAVPEATWGARWVGSSAVPCVVAILLLAIGPLAGLLVALRYGAPTRPGLAGAVAGLAASGIAATFYAAHCPDDSPLFVATWYSIATALVVLVGYAAGLKLLEWPSASELRRSLLDPGHEASHRSGLRQS